MRAAALTEPGIWIAAIAIGLVTFGAVTSVLDSLIDVFWPENPLYVPRTDRFS